MLPLLENSISSLIYLCLIDKVMYYHAPIGGVLFLFIPDLPVYLIWSCSHLWRTLISSLIYLCQIVWVLYYHASISLLLLLIPDLPVSSLIYLCLIDKVMYYHVSIHSISSLCMHYTMYLSCLAAVLVLNFSRHKTEFHIVTSQ